MSTLLLIGIGFSAVYVVQDRPQTFSLVFIAALVPVIRRAVVDDKPPAAWQLILGTWIWANIHGLWIVAPFVLALVALTRLAEHRRDWRMPAILTVACTAVAGLTPVGPALLLTPWRISRSTQSIAEWQPTALSSPLAWGLALTLVLMVVGWARIPVSQRAS